MSKFEKPIMAAAREQFSRYGYDGAKIDAIAAEARVNKRLVYEFCHSKDGLYMAVLSAVSREAVQEFERHVGAMTGSVRNIYGELFSILENLGDFLRLWAWERMSPTIHGPRILETVNMIFERVRGIVLEKAARGEIPEASQIEFEAIEALCHGYLLTAAMYFRCEPETDVSEAASPDGNGIVISSAFRRLNMSMHVQSIILDSISKLVG